MALELAAQGIPFRIVDKIPQRSDKSKALAVQPRSLEVMARHGPVERLIERGNANLGGAIFVNGKKTVDVNLGGVTATRDSAFPHTILAPQSLTEGFLAECLATRYGRSVEFGTEATSIKQDASGVTVTLRKRSSSSPLSSSASSTSSASTKVDDSDNAANGTQADEETIRAKYVVGADGAHSIVRHATSVQFEGDAYPQDFILCDARLRNSSMSRDRFRICMRYGLLLVFPLGNDVVRLVASRPGVPRHGRARPQGLPGLARLHGPRRRRGDHDPIWLTRFKLHHRVSTNYRDGRLFLAGDAAHIHSPAGGQGMNTGIQDSVNLGWKLASVLRGEQPDAFLDSYNEERRPIGLRILGSSDYLFNVLGVRYRHSSIVGTAEGFSGPVSGGDRAPDGPLIGYGKDKGERELKKQKQGMRLHQLLVPNKHHLVLFSGAKSSEAASVDDLQQAAKTFRDGNSGCAALVHTLIAGSSSDSDRLSSPKSGSYYLDADGVLHRRYGFEDGLGYAYIRPDGHVAHIGPLSALPSFMKWVK
ncbi:hypothetical protein PG987_000354 [Apiospora arundinis]